MEEVGSPTVRRRELGAQLRALRTERGFTVDQVAARLLCSPSKVSRMETGQRGATLRDVRDLCDLYGVTDETKREHLMYLARQGKRPGWWQGYELGFATYVGLEESVVSVKHFTSSTVMGLVQTEDYARALHEAGPEDFAPGRIDELIEVRLKRQQVLERDHPMELHLVFDEAVLHRPVGGSVVMGKQLVRLAEYARLPYIRIQVVPYGVGAHPAMDSNFTVLEFGGLARDVVFVEGLFGNMYLERDQDLSRYNGVFERLCHLALDPQESMKMIAGIAAENYNVANPAHGASSE